MFSTAWTFIRFYNIANNTYGTMKEIDKEVFRFSELQNTARHPDLLVWTMFFAALTMTRTAREKAEVHRRWEFSVSLVSCSWGWTTESYQPYSVKRVLDTAGLGRVTSGDICVL